MAKLPKLPKVLIASTITIPSVIAACLVIDLDSKHVNDELYFHEDTQTEFSGHAGVNFSTIAFRASVLNKKNNEKVDQCTFTVTPSLPDGLELDENTGVISGTTYSPINNGVHTIKCHKEQHISGSIDINITINKNALAFNSDQIQTSYSGIVNNNNFVTQNLSSLLTDKFGNSVNNVSFSIDESTHLPNGLSIDPNTGIISGTPTNTQDFQQYKIIASSRGYEDAYIYVSIEVRNNLCFEEAVVQNYSAYTCATGDYSIRTQDLSDKVYDANNNKITGCTFYVSPSVSNGLSFNSSTGVISGTSTVVFNQTYLITSHKEEYEDSDPLEININIDSNVLTIDQSCAKTYNGYANATEEYEINTDDLSNKVIDSNGTLVSECSFSISPSLTNGLSFNSSTGVISGITTDAFYQAYSITAHKNNYSSSIGLEVAIAIDSNVLTIDQSCAKTYNGYANATEEYEINTDDLSNKVTDSNGVIINDCEFELDSSSQSLESGLILNNATGVIKGTTTTTLNGAKYKIIAKKNGYIVSSPLEISINIEHNALHFPNAEGLQYTGYTNASNEHIITTQDLRSLVLDANNAPVSDVVFTTNNEVAPGLSFDSSTGVISGTSTTRITETYYIFATKEGYTSSTYKTINITINTNTLSISDTGVTRTLVYTKGVTINSTADLSNNVADKNGTNITGCSFSISPSLPTGLIFNNDTGVISGTPAEDSNASYTITASKDGYNSGTIIVNLSVVAPALQISGYDSDIVLTNANVLLVGSWSKFYDEYTGPTPQVKSNGVVVNGSSFTVSPALPSGLKIDGSNGKIDGKLNDSSWSMAKKQYTITATKSGYVSATFSFYITINVEEQRL